MRRLIILCPLKCFGSIRVDRNGYSIGFGVGSSTLAAHQPIVAHVTPWYLPHIGDLERHVEAISGGISAFESTILTPRLRGTSSIERPAQNVMVRRFGPIKHPPGPEPRPFAAARDWIARLARLRNLREALQDIKFDILHVHRPPLIDLAYFVARRGQIPALQYLARRLNRLPTGHRPQVLTDHGMFVMPSTPVPLDIRWFMEWVLDEFDHVICVDKSGFERAQMFRQSDPSRFEDVTIHHIPQPMDTNLFRPTPMPQSGDLIVGYSGRWERDGMFILQSLVKERLPGVGFVVGGGATRHDLAIYGQAFSKMGVEVRPNLLDSSDLVRFYRDIHVLVDFYGGDGCGRSVLEAMACGRPVVRTTSRDTHPVSDGETGFLVSPDVSAYARKLRDILGHKEEVKEMGRRARRILEDEYGARVVLARIEKVYRDCMASGRRHVR